MRICSKFSNLWYKKYRRECGEKNVVSFLSLILNNNKQVKINNCAVFAIKRLSFMIYLNMWIIVRKKHL